MDGVAHSAFRYAKIGFNVHNRGDYTVGNYRMFELPANGAMQIMSGMADVCSECRTSRVEPGGSLLSS